MSKENNNPTLQAHIISDLWGHRSCKWWENFKVNLGPKYKVTILDASTLAGIDTSIHKQEEIHDAFIQGGLETAVSELILRTEKTDLLMGCSIGGVIAWRACLKGLQAEKLITLSSTRLRDETSKPPCTIQVIFGTEDSFSPNEGWYEKMNIIPTIMTNHGHNLYMENDVWKSINLYQ